MDAQHYFVGDRSGHLADAQMATWQTRWDQVAMIIGVTPRFTEKEQ